MSDQYLAEQVRVALAVDPRTAAPGLDVKVIADRLYITGTATSAEQCAAIGEVAAETAGDLAVQNDVVLVPCDESADAEDLT